MLLNRPDFVPHINKMAHFQPLYFPTKRISAAMTMHPSKFRHLQENVEFPRVAPEIFRRGADSSYEGAKIWYLGYYKCQKSPKNRVSPSDGGLACSDGGLYPPSTVLAPPLRISTNKKCTTQQCVGVVYCVSYKGFSARQCETKMRIFSQ